MHKRKTGEGRMLVMVDVPLDSVESSNMLANELESIMNDGFRSIILDMDKVSKINTNGIGKILVFYKRLHEEGGALYFKTPMMGGAKEVLDEIGLTSLVGQYGGAQ